MKLAITTKYGTTQIDVDTRLAYPMTKHQIDNLPRAGEDLADMLHGNIGDRGGLDTVIAEERARLTGALERAGVVPPISDTRALQAAIDDYGCNFVDGTLGYYKAVGSPKYQRDGRGTEARLNYEYAVREVAVFILSRKHGIHYNGTPA